MAKKKATKSSENSDQDAAGVQADINFELADADLEFAEIAEESELSDETEITDISDISDDSELAAFESAEIEDVEKLSEEQIVSIVESLLFATEKPQSVAMLKSAFQGTHVRSAQIRVALNQLQLDYSNPLRGVMLIEAAGGYQLRTRVENQKYLHRTIKARPFRLSGPALEVLSIVAYKQPCTKSQVDEIRGVESGHLMRGLLDRGLIHFGEKSELPGRPMFYETTRKFLEIFGLRNTSELPSLSEIDQLIPEGIGEMPEEKETLSELTGKLSTEVVANSYSVGEEELLDISSELKTIQTSTDFFEQEKIRQREKRDAERAQDIQERMAVGEPVEEKDKRWLAKYELSLRPPQEFIVAEQAEPSNEP